MYSSQFLFGILISSFEFLFFLFVFTLQCIICNKQCEKKKKLNVEMCLLAILNMIFNCGMHASLAFTLHLDDFTASHNASVAFLRWFVKLRIGRF